MSKKAIIDTTAMRGKKTQKLSGDVCNHELKIARPKPGPDERCVSGCGRKPAWAGAEYCTPCGKSYAALLKETVP